MSTRFVFWRRRKVGSPPCVLLCRNSGSGSGGKKLGVTKTAAAGGWTWSGVGCVVCGFPRTWGATGGGANDLREPSRFFCLSKTLEKLSYTPSVSCLSLSCSWCNLTWSSVCNCPTVWVNFLTSTLAPSTSLVVADRKSTIP